MDFKKKYTVFIHDITDEMMTEMIDFCHTNNLHLEKYQNVDISDLSLQWDTLASFDFTDEDDVIVLKLRFKTK